MFSFIIAKVNMYLASTRKCLTITFIDVCFGLKFHSVYSCMHNKNMAIATYNIIQ